MKRFTIAIAGNPNCGKTTLFNSLTGARQRVGNWPGVTVDRKEGFYRYGEYEIRVVDTPGIYSMSASSIDEQVARDYVLSGDAGLVVNIVDASNIERNLYLTSQLLEMRVAVVIALNMMDVAKDRRIEIDVEGLSRRLGCTVVPVVASKNQGVDELKRVIDRQIAGMKPTAAKIVYPVEVQDAIGRLLPMIEPVAIKNDVNASWLAIKLLEGDELAITMVDKPALKKALALQEVIEDRLGEDADIVIASARYGFIHWLTEDTVKKIGQLKPPISDRIDKVVLNRILGVPVFLLAMYLMFLFTINVGGAFIDFFDQLAGAIFVDGFARVLTAMHSPVWFKTILADGVGGGIQTMATFIPPIGFMFLCLSFLEDSGYMARAAFVMDRFMRFIGLPGKSFIPMLVGFGCNVPAIMATRTLENERDRLLTIMMNPFMSCGARLPVYALFAAAFFTHGGQNLVFLLYLVGIGFAVITGLILKNTLLKGEITPFVMELPPYHLPTLKSVLLRSYDRLRAFLFRAGKILIPVIVVLVFFNSLGTDGTFGNEDSPKSMLSSIGRAITPAFAPMGITQENWPATVGLFTGIFAKETVVGTLDSLYSGMDQRANDVKERNEDFDLTEAIVGSFATIPANLREVAGAVLDPLGLSMAETSDMDEASRELDVSRNTFGSMVTLFGSKVSAFAYLLFVLLYFPCSAAIAAVYRETNFRWTLFAGFWTTFMAYLASTFFYQVATFGSHPADSITWIVGDITAFVAALVTLKFFGARGEKGGKSLTVAQAAKG